MSTVIEHFYKRIYIGQNQAVAVRATLSANAMLLDETNYAMYKNGQKFTYSGGQVTTTPYIIVPQFPGNWILVVDLGGRPGSISCSAEIVDL